MSEENFTRNMLQDFVDWASARNITAATPTDIDQFLAWIHEQHLAELQATRIKDFLPAGEGPRAITLHLSLNQAAAIVDAFAEVAMIGQWQDAARSANADDD